MRGDFKSVSGSAVERADDFQRLWHDPKVDAIIPTWGGELLLNILPLLDFSELSKNPKWLLGYSDISTLLFCLTLKTGISTAHGMNFMDADLEQNDSLSRQTYDILALKPGETITQLSSAKHQIHFSDFAKNIGATFNLAKNTEWKSLDASAEVKFSGRIIGGCLDTLRNLIDTPYGNLPEFAARFKSDGLILYLENADSAPAEVCRALWNMKLAGWFDAVRGVIFGRSGGPDETNPDVFSYIDALHDVFTGSPFPVIYDADIGHQPPQLTILNGCIATLRYKSGAGSFTQTLV